MSSQGGPVSVMFPGPKRQQTRFCTIHRLLTSSSKLWSCSWPCQSIRLGRICEWKGRWDESWAGSGKSFSLMLSRMFTMIRGLYRIKTNRSDGTGPLGAWNFLRVFIVSRGSWDTLDLISSSKRTNAQDYHIKLHSPCVVRVPQPTPT